MDGAMLIIRLLFVITTASAAYQISIATSGTHPFSVVNIASIVFAALFSVFVIWVEIKYASKFILSIFTIIVGLLIGFVASSLFTQGLFLIPHFRILQESIPPNIFEQIQDSTQVGITFFFCYMAVAILFKTQNRFRLLIPFVDLTKESMETSLILDTSAIIDGRIVSLCENNILRGVIVVPRFVLEELQALSDSSDRYKRMRGRRGLEILDELRNRIKTEFRLDPQTFPEIAGADQKLVKLGQMNRGILVTSDYNLKKIAAIQRVDVINLNSLSHALRPPVLPGDTLDIQIIKDGEEAHQGIGYLQDGTVVVVENGRHAIGQSIPVVVTNILQTNMGRMVFGKISSDPARSQS